LPAFGAQGFAAFVALGAHGLAILPDFGAQGFEPCAAAGTGAAAIIPLMAAIDPRVCSDFLSVAMHFSFGLKNRRAS
jgi:hypothetical protein